MGNKLVRRRQVVDDKYTRPQGLYPIGDVDYKKLRKLILEAKLAPCYPGSEECDSRLLEECPICFLYYPTLNRSRCCMKSICTECFLQLKTLNSAHPAQCPFCKTSNYAVEYRGVKSEEERGQEQIEEQKVIEAKIRMRQLEVQVEEGIMHKRHEKSFSQGVMQTQDIQCSRGISVEGEAVVSSQDSNATPLFSILESTQHYQDEMADVDLEDIMLMEAINLSIQENNRQRNASRGHTTREQCSSPSTSFVSAEFSDDFEIASVTMTSHGRDWSHHRSEAAEPRTSYASSTESDYLGEPLPPPPPPAMSPESAYGSSMIHTSVYESEDDQGFSCLLLSPPSPPPLLPPYPEPVVAETFEERVMQAMAVSLSGARASIVARGAAWD